MIYVAVILAAATGIAIGYMLVAVLRRRAASPEHAARRHQSIVIGGVVLCAAYLTFDAVVTEKHRYFNLVIVALMAGALAFDWFRGRRRRSTMS